MYEIHNINATREQLHIQALKGRYKTAQGEQSGSSRDA